MKPKLLLGLALVLSGGLFGYLCFWSPVQNAASKPGLGHPVCRDNLRWIDSTKHQWALEHNKMTNDVPTWSDLLPYMKKMPVCPDGGSYTVGIVGTVPVCSIGGHRHSFP